MMVDDVMVAPVLSQPSMPFASGKAARGADLNLSPDDREVVAQRAAAGCQVLGPAVHRRQAGRHPLRLAARAARRRVHRRRAAQQLKKDHSVLTEQRDEPSVQRVLSFFQEKLHP
jgi:hypothetical protein